MPFDLASLRTRLVLIPTAILFIGMAATIGFILTGARPRVQAEVNSGMRLGRLLIQDALRDVAASADPNRALAQFEGSLPRVRHVRFVLAPGPAPTEKPPREPAWVFRLLAPRAQRDSFPIVVRGQTVGRVLMQSNPSDEINEIWSEVQLLAALLGGLWVLITAMIFWAVGLSLRPLRNLAEAFDSLEHGRFQPLPVIQVAELRRIGARFNSLGRTLERVTADNHLLIDRMMSVQEAERKEIARELHDEFGPALFGIRADAACITRWTKEGSARASDIEERSRSIAGLTDGIQKITYQMLDRLRPLVLEQMGLREALRQLVASWQERYPDTAWSLRLSPS
ncbi:MAG: histidine kinase, partial [Acetobacteraceae bacterium]